MEVLRGPFLLDLVNSPVNRIDTRLSSFTCENVFDYTTLDLDTPDLGAGGDEARIYITLEAESVASTKVVGAAPPALSVGYTSVPKITFRGAASDVNRDGQTDLIDLALVSNYLREMELAPSTIDANGDRVVTIADLVMSHSILR